jgi:hypothetical protein
MDEPNCFASPTGFVFHGKSDVLEDVSIDDGSQKMFDHVNHKD